MTGRSPRTPVLHRAAGAAAIVLILGAAAPHAAGAEGPAPESAEISAGRLERFASILDEAIGGSRVPGIYARGPSFAFRLEGHGPVFVIRALRSPLGAATDYLRIMSETLARSSADSRPGAQAGHRQERLLLRQEEEMQRLARQLEQTAGSLEILAVREAGGATAPRGQGRLLELLRLEATVAALEARVASLAARAGDAPAGSARAEEPAAGSPVDLLERRLLEALLTEGRAVASRDSDQVSIVLLVSRVGGGQEAATLQISARGSDLPSSRDPEALRRAEEKVRRVRTGF